MTLTEFLKNNPLKGKAVCLALVQALAENVFSIEQLLNEMPSLKQTDKANCMEAITLTVTENAALFPSTELPKLTQFLKDPSARVQWECARCIAALAPMHKANWRYHTEALLHNAQKGGTVVRWSAATALLAIYLSNKTAYAYLHSAIKSCLELEEKNSIQKIYKQAFK